MNTYDPIEWSDSLSTGVEEIDRQHQSLVKIINEANAKLIGNQSLQLIDDLTFDLFVYASYHFETEERLIEKYDYPVECPDEAETHCSEHRSFSEKVTAVRADLKRGVVISREDLLSFLNQWLIEHILNIDMRLGQFLVSKGMT